MTLKTRRIIFYSFVLIFLVATPPTILYSIGYSFDWQKKAIIQTGGIYLKSTPSQAEIYINNKLKKTTPRLISRLLPKTYSVKIAKNGYFTWQKNFEVFPQKVTENRNIILFPQKIETEKIAENSTSTIKYFLSTEEEKQNQAKAMLIASSSIAWILQNNELFYISKENNILYRSDLSGFIKKQISQKPLPAGNYKIIALNANKIALIDGEKNLYLLKENKAFEKIAENAQDAVFSDDAKKILWISGNEIWVEWLDDFLAQPFRKIGDKEMITRYASPIKQAIFYPDGEHIAFVVGEKIKITEIDGRDKRNTIDLVRAKNPQIYFDSKKD